MKLFNKKSLTAVVAVLSIVGILAVLAVVFSPGTIVEESQRDRVTFAHITDGAYARPNMEDVFDKKYDGVHGDVAVVEKLRVDSSMYGGMSNADGCFVNPEVELNGETVDNYNLQDNKIVRYPWPVDKEDTENREASYGPFQAEFANPLYMEFSVWRGYLVSGSLQCYGPFNRYHLNVPFDKISMKTETPDNITEGEPLTATVRFENDWKPLKANLTGEVCVRGSFCKKVEEQQVEVPTGSSTVELQTASAEETNATGSMSVDLSGVIGLDASKMEFQNVAVDCDTDGDFENASQCSMIQIGEITGQGVTTILKSPEQPPNPETGLKTAISKIVNGFLRIITSRG